MTADDIVRIIDSPGEGVNHNISTGDSVFLLSNTHPPVAILYCDLLYPYYVVLVEPAIDQCDPGFTCKTLEEAMAHYMQLVAKVETTGGKDTGL